VIEVNATIVLQVINFLVLVYILNRLLVKPVMKTINSRREYVEGKYSRVEELEKKREAELMKFQTEISKARREALKKRNEIKAAGEREREQLIEKASTEGEKIVESVRSNLSKEIVNVQRELEQKLEDMVLLVTEKVLGRKA